MRTEPSGILADTSARSGHYFRHESARPGRFQQQTTNPEIHRTMKIEAHLLTAAAVALLAAQIPFATLTHAEEAQATRQQDFENPADFKELGAGFHWAGNGGVDDSACLVIERENTSDYETLGIFKLTHPEPGTYNVSAEMKVEEVGQGPALGTVFIDLYDKDQYVPIEPAGFSSGTTGDVWVRVEGQVVIPEGITSGWIGTSIAKGYTGKVSIDNMVLQKVEQ